MPTEIYIANAIIIKCKDNIAFEDSMRIPRLRWRIRQNWMRLILPLEHEQSNSHLSPVARKKKVWGGPHKNDCEVGRLGVSRDACQFFSPCHFGKLISFIGRGSIPRGSAALALCIKVSFASHVFLLLFSYIREQVMATNNYKTQRALGTYHCTNTERALQNGFSFQLSTYWWFPDQVLHSGTKPESSKKFSSSTNDKWW